MAAEGKAIIFYRCNLSFFISSLVSIDKRPAMGSQPNLASRSEEVVSIYKCPKISGILPQNLGLRKHQIYDHFFCDFRTRHRISPERNVASTKTQVSIYNESPSVDILSVTFDPENAEIRSVIVIHPSAAITLQPS